VPVTVDNSAATPSPWYRTFEAGWLLAAVLVPLAANPWGHSPFVPLRVAVLRTVVFCLVLAWALRVLVVPKASRAAASPLLAPALCLIAVEAAATVLAVNPAFSLWGSYERGQGLLTLVCYPLLGLIVASEMTGLRQARRLLFAMQVTAVPVLLIAVAQYAGWDAGLVTDARSPIFATLGRSNFVAAYLAMLMPLTLVQAAAAVGRRRLAWTLLLAAEAVVLVLTRVRGGWLAALVGITVVLVLWFRRELATWWGRPALRLAIIASGSATVAAAIAVARAGGSGAARLAIWQGCLRLVFERPFLGYGPDALLLVFPGVYPPELVYHQGREFLVDRAHNFVLDWSVTVGVLGLVAWLAVLWTVVSVALHRLREGEPGSGHQPILIAALAALAANLGGNLISFDVTTTSTLTWLLLGTMVALTVRHDAAPAAATPCDAPGTWQRPVVLVLGIGLGIAILLFNLRPVVADVWMHRAHRLAESDPAAAVHAAERAVQWWPREAQHFLALAALSESDARRAASEDEIDLRPTEAALQRAIALQPQRFDLWLELGRLYARWPGQPSIDVTERADAAFREAVQRAPNHAVVYGSWAGLLLDLGNLPGALEMFREAVDLDATDFAAWTRLGEVQLALGRVPEARFSFERALTVAPEFVPSLLGLAEALLQMGDNEGAAAIVDRALELEPENEAAQELAQRLSQPPPGSPSAP
jgi:O-antigen ligase/cytochrome c-type biogenesis protein CcmH/NrfG